MTGFETVHPPVRAILFDSSGTLIRPDADPHRFRPYPEVPATLRRLHRQGLVMAVVTDSLEPVEPGYARIGLARYFRFFAVAGEVGATKPDAALYRAASDALGVPPAQTYYLDDQPGLVAAAGDLGYRGLAVCRDGASAPPGMPSIAALDELRV